MRGRPRRGTSQTSDWSGRSITVQSRAPILPSGLICRIAASSLTLNDGDTLPATINDLSGVGNAAARVGSPTYQAGETATGLGAMRPAGSGYLTIGSSMWTGKTAGHLFLYVKCEPISNYVYGPWRIGGGDNPWWPFNGTYQESALTSTRYDLPAPSPSPANAWRIIEVACGGGSWRVLIDGSQQGISQSTSFTAPGTTYLLWNNNATARADSLVAEYQAYDRVLESGEAQRVRDFLTGVYGATG